MTIKEAMEVEWPQRGSGLGQYRSVKAEGLYKSRAGGAAGGRRRGQQEEGGEEEKDNIREPLTEVREKMSKCILSKTCHF